ncbi:hypothetical protein [Baekduia sp. Peel2402]|uniref:hypothetical protein n=1 Tax=Baekduia sp. Peel2402 TaxID=3458296 RepID=UPI00403E3762
MSRISRLVVLVASVAAVVSAMAGTASAVTWHVAGTGSFTAAGTPGTLSSSTGGNLVCPASSATGTYAAGPFVGVTYSGISGTVNYTGCSLAGQGVFVNCGYRLTATAQPTVTTLTTGTADVTCGLTLTSSPTTKLCHIEGSVLGTYHDRTGSADTLTIATSSTLRSTGAGCALGSNDPAHLSEGTFTITSNGGNGPHIVRTA